MQARDVLLRMSILGKSVIEQNTDDCEALLRQKTTRHFEKAITFCYVYEQLLPLERVAEQNGSIEPIYVGEPEDILNKIIPEYVGGVLNSAVCESLAAESAARRTAMNAANKNASEIIDTLVLKYNRARQAVITQEITEIVSGSEAL